MNSGYSSQSDGNVLSLLISIPHFLVVIKLLFFHPSYWCKPCLRCTAEKRIVSWYFITDIRFDINWWGLWISFSNQWECYIIINWYPTFLVVIKLLIFHHHIIIFILICQGSQFHHLSLNQRLYLLEKDSIITLMFYCGY